MTWDVGLATAMATSSPAPRCPASVDLHREVRCRTVVGGADGQDRISQRDALEWSAAAPVTRPVFWVGQGFEYCGSTIPIPAEVEAADIYLFHHFADFFPIKDPLLVRVTSSDARSHHQQFVVMRPQETRHFTLDELLPDREGTAVIEIRTTASRADGESSPRAGGCGPISSGATSADEGLHGAHDYGTLTTSAESRLPVSEFSGGSLVLTLPNYDHQLSESDSAVRWTRSGEKGSFPRDGARSIEEITVPGKAKTARRQSGIPWGLPVSGTRHVVLVRVRRGVRRRPSIAARQPRGHHRAGRASPSARR